MLRPGHKCLSGAMHLFVDLAAEIAGCRPRCGPVRLVAIDGPGGAGKSAFASRLAAAFASSEEVTLLHTDDFASWDVPVDWWPRLEQQVLNPIRCGQDPRFQRYDWGTRRMAEWIHVPRTPVIILEGVSSARAAVAPEFSYAIWIATARQTRLERGLARDGDHARAQWDEWMATEDHHFAIDDTRQRADLVVDGDPQPRPPDPERCCVELIQ